MRTKTAFSINSMLRKTLAASALAASVLIWGPAFGQIVDDPLHGFCWGSSSCTDNGNNTPVSANPPQFGFSISPGPKTGDFLVVFLVPSELPLLSSILFNGTHGGTANLSLISATATQVGGVWASGTLDGFLGLAASPNNPIGAYIGINDTADPTVTGFNVYEADLGQTKLWDNPNETNGPLMSNGGLPLGTYIVGFLETGGVDSKTGLPIAVATANSGAILETGIPPQNGCLNGATNFPICTFSNAPEPSSMLIFGGGLLGLATVLRRRRGV